MLELDKINPGKGTVALRLLVLDIARKISVILPQL